MRIEFNDYKISAQELAQMFVDSGSDEQAEFINQIGKEFKKARERWGKAGSAAEMQCCYLSDDIDQDGKDFIYCLANYLKMRGLGDKRYNEYYDGKDLDIG
jgi:hypothetical protein